MLTAAAHPGLQEESTMHAASIRALPGKRVRGSHARCKIVQGKCKDPHYIDQSRPYSDSGKLIRIDHQNSVLFNFYIALCVFLAYIFTVNTENNTPTYNPFPCRGSECPAWILQVGMYIVCVQQQHQNWYITNKALFISFRGPQINKLSSKQLAYI
jgi:hypothetical protein